MKVSRNVLWIYGWGTSVFLFAYFFEKFHSDCWFIFVVVSFLMLSGGSIWWLKGKVKMKLLLKQLCKFGFHDWSNWQRTLWGNRDYRWCRRCGKQQDRRIF